MLDGGGLEFGVGEDDEFSHDCGDCDEGFFAGLDQAFVEGFEVWIVFAGGEGGHEEDAFDLGSSAACPAVAFGVAALFGMRREGGGLAAIERSELGHEGDESSGGLVAEAGDGDERLEGPGDRLALGGQGLDIGFDRRDLRIEAFDERIEIAALRSRRRGRRRDWRRRGDP